MTISTDLELVELAAKSIEPDTSPQWAWAKGYRAGVMALGADPSVAQCLADITALRAENGRLKQRIFELEFRVESLRTIRGDT